MGIVIYTDGGCNPNPGPGGWGVFIVDGAAERKISGGSLNTTNNRMELTAVIKSLESIKSDGREVLIYSDSKYVVDGITKWVFGWRDRGWTLKGGNPVKNVDLWQRLYDLTRERTVRFKWVKGHSFNEGNQQADELATAGRQKILRQQSNSI